MLKLKLPQYVMAHLEKIMEKSSEFSLLGLCLIHQPLQEIVEALNQGDWRRNKQGCGQPSPPSQSVLHSGRRAPACQAWHPQILGSVLISASQGCAEAHQPLH